MYDKYCNNCKRMVGAKKNVTPGLVCIAIGVVVAMFIPFLGWILGFILVIAGITMILCAGSKCPICGSKYLSQSKPVEPAKPVMPASAQQKASEEKQEDTNANQ